MVKNGWGLVPLTIQRCVTRVKDMKEDKLFAGGGAMVLDTTQRVFVERNGRMLSQKCWQITTAGSGWVWHTSGEDCFLFQDVFHVCLWKWEIAVIQLATVNYSQFL